MTSEVLALIGTQILTGVTVGVVVYRLLRRRLDVLRMRTELLHRKVNRVLRNVRRVVRTTHPRLADMKEKLDRMDAMVSPDARKLRIVVNTLPKTGSSAICEVLQQAMPQATLEHTHAISLEGQHALARTIDETGTSHGRQVLNTLHARMRRLRPELERLRSENPDEPSVTFACGVREPIAWALSTMFQLLESELISDDVLQTDVARRVIMEWLNGHSPCAYLPRPEDWLQREIGGYLGLNVMELPFDVTRGFQTYGTQRGRLLMIRQENLDRLPEASAELLIAPRSLFQSARANVTGEKNHGPRYNEMRSELRFPASFVEELYARPYAATFYSAAERSAFASKWREGCEPAGRMQEMTDGKKDAKVSRSLGLLSS